LRRRLRRLGLVETLGQLGTMVAIRLMKRASARRIAAIVTAEGLRTEPDPLHRQHRVASVNDPAFAALIAELRPAVLLLAGCRLLRRETLAAMPCPVLNYHAGITPAYRGMNGGYFALAQDDAANFGATVHLVDAGVDTGGVLHQVRTRPGRGDSIATYPMLLAAAARGICVTAVGEALDGRLRPVAVDLPSRQWYHPTLWRYLATGLRRGIW
jgi:folate-dependent phosphoribosylglycinamide formyltransferase PurN